MGRGRFRFPAFPRPRALPWVLAALSSASLAYGLAGGSDGATVIGAVGLLFVALAYALARLIVPETGARDDTEP